MRTKTMNILFAFLMIAMSAQAQISLGVKSNLILNDTEVASGTIDLDKTVESMQGYSVGGYAEYTRNENWSLSSDLLYRHIGFQVVESTSFGLFGVDVPIGATLKTTVNYLELPVMVKYRHDLGGITAYVEAGPSFSYALNGQVKTTANSILDFNVTETALNLSTDTYSRINTAANIGAGASYLFAEDMIVTAGIRYTKDLTDSVNLPIVDARIRNKSFGLGISLGKRF